MEVSAYVLQTAYFKKKFIDTISINKIINWEEVSLKLKNLNLSGGNVSD